MAAARGNANALTLDIAEPLQVTRSAQKVMKRGKCGAGSAASAFLMILVGACSPVSGVAEPPGDPYLRGWVESMIHRATASNMVVRPEAGSSDPCGIAATVDGETVFLRRTAPAGELSASALSEIAVGDTVEVYVSGPVAESCPVQARATTIVRIGS